jgi:hypothetical protein
LKTLRMRRWSRAAWFLQSSSHSFVYWVFEFE